MCTFCHGSRFPLFRYAISDYEGIEISHKRKIFTLFKQCSIHKINNTPSKFTKQAFLCPLWVPSELQLIKPEHIWTPDALANKERGHHKEKRGTATQSHLPPETDFNEYVLASQGNPQRSHFALSRNTWDSSALPCVENSSKQAR